MRGLFDKEPEITDFGDIFQPAEAVEPILSKAVSAALTEWLEEIWAEVQLKAVGLKPRKRAIFDGPPGVGKTTLAHHLAARLGLPMLAVRPDRMIDKYLGSTGRNIGDLFECVRKQGHMVLFLDEFDALAPKRVAAQSGAETERNNSVNTLLQRLEQHDGFIIAATNFGDHIDPAMWRRFDMHITLELPGQRERERILARYLEPYGFTKAEFKALAESLETASPALIRSLCEGVKRQLVMGPVLKHEMHKTAVFERLLAACHPAPGAGKPRLWSHGAADKGLQSIGWPLKLAADIQEDAGEPAVEPQDNIVALRRP